MLRRGLPFALVMLGACGGEPLPAQPAPAAQEAAAPAAPPAPAPAAPPPGSPSAPTPAPLGAPYPIVLLHGMGGFGTVTAGAVTSTYFAGVEGDLAAMGETVFVTVAPPYATSEARAAALAPQIDAILAKTGRAKVNLVGHSQGGLDARVLASPAGLGYGDRVASITTIATPHRGSALTDATLRWLEWVPGSSGASAVDAYLTYLQRSVYDVDGDPDLRAQLTHMTEAYMRDTFNPRFIDAPGVVYKSYAGRTNLRNGAFACTGATYANEYWKLDVAQGSFTASSLYLEEGRLAVNDGLVTVESARWGTFEACIPADHLKQIGHVGVAATFDHKTLFRDIVTRTRQAGF